MSDKILFVAKRTVLTKMFVGFMIGAILGVMLLILGFISLGTGGLGLGGIIFLVTGIGALIEGVKMKSNKIEFYQNKYKIKSGVLNKHESEVLLTNLLSISVHQSMWGRLFQFGDVYINLVGKKDISLTGVKNPHELKRYVESLLAKTDLDSIKQIIQE